VDIQVVLVEFILVLAVLVVSVVAFTQALVEVVV